MTRGTTPTFILRIEDEIDFHEVELFYVTFRQAGRLVTVKEPVVDYDEKTISVELTQEETLKFSATKPVELQLRGKFYDTTAFATNIIPVDINPVLYEEVI